MIGLFRGDKAPGKRDQYILLVLPSNLGRRGFFLGHSVIDGHTLAFLWMLLYPEGEESKRPRGCVHLEPMWPPLTMLLGSWTLEFSADQHWSCFKALCFFSGSFSVNTPRPSTYWLGCPHVYVRGPSRCMMEPGVEEKEGGQGPGIGARAWLFPKSCSNTKLQGVPRF